MSPSKKNCMRLLSYSNLRRTPHYSFCKWQTKVLLCALNRLVDDRKSRAQSQHIYNKERGRYLCEKAAADFQSLQFLILLLPNLVLLRKHRKEQAKASYSYSQHRRGGMRVWGVYTVLNARAHSLIPLKLMSSLDLSPRSVAVITRSLQLGAMPALADDSDDEVVLRAAATSRQRKHRAQATGGDADSTRSNSAVRSRARSQLSVDHVDTQRDADSTSRAVARSQLPADYVDVHRRA